MKNATKVVSFRLPVKDYAALLAEAADNQMDLADLVIARLYGAGTKFKRGGALSNYFVDMAKNIASGAPENQEIAIRFKPDQIAEIKKNLAAIGVK